MASDRVSTPLPDPLDGVVDCPACRVHAVANPHLRGAAASVGLSHTTSTETTLARYLAVFHRGGHRDETGGQGRG